MSNLRAWMLFTGALFALTAVVLGAFGAHALKEVLSPDQLTSYETGVRYQMYHALALILLSLRGALITLRFEKAILFLFTMGILLFSCSIYLLNLQTVLGINLKWLGPITPLGGSLLIIGWALLLVNAGQLLRTKKS